MQIPTRETFLFVERVLGRGSRRILEVGCGKGDLAAALIQAGHEVLAIDTDPEAIREARAQGVNAERADILGFDGAGFDAVLFTRSLHHVHPLDEALGRARKALRPGGLLLCEEFAREAADLATAAWLYDAIDWLETAGAIRINPDDSPKALPILERWRADHPADHLHTGAAMQAAIEARFSEVRAETAPYQYRTLAARARDPRLPELAWNRENLALREGRIRPVGLRITARCA